MRPNVKIILPVLWFFPLLLFCQTPTASNDSFEIVLSKAIYFDFGMFDLKQDADSVLAEIKKAYLEVNEANIKITAHTDAIGSNQNNWTLSQKRGEIVRKYLIKNGLPSDEIEVDVFGEENPIAENDNDDGRQKNRRATIEVLKKIPKEPMTFVEGQVKDKVTGEGIEADVVIHGKELRDSFRTDNKGYFKRAVPENIVIGIDIYASGYFYDTQMLKTKTGVKPRLSFDLPQIKTGASIDIKNLYFVGNKAVMLPRSKPELPKILKFMQLNDSIRIEIGGHVNVPNVHPDKIALWSYMLSISRAKMVYDYLVANNIPEHRLKFKGYGNSKMRFPKGGSFREQEMNRRVEIKILGTEEVVSEEEAMPGEH